jgi:hypothetical protein
LLCSPDLHGFFEFRVFVPPAIERRQVKSHELGHLDIRKAKCAKLSRLSTQLRPKTTQMIQRFAIVLPFPRLEELRPPLLPSEQTSSAYTEVGRYPLIANTSLTQGTNLLDIFLAELGRLTSASLVVRVLVLARHGGAFMVPRRFGARFRLLLVYNFRMQRLIGGPACSICSAGANLPRWKYRHITADLAISATTVLAL